MRTELVLCTSRAREDYNEIAGIGHDNQVHFVCLNVLRLRCQITLIRCCCFQRSALREAPTTGLSARCQVRRQSRPLSCCCACCCACRHEGFIVYALFYRLSPRGPQNLANEWIHMYLCVCECAFTCIYMFIFIEQQRRNYTAPPPPLASPLLLSVTD